MTSATGLLEKVAAHGIRLTAAPIAGKLVIDKPELLTDELWEELVVHKPELLPLLTSWPAISLRPLVGSTVLTPCGQGILRAVATRTAAVVFYGDPRPRFFRWSEIKSTEVRP